MLIYLIPFQRIKSQIRDLRFVNFSNMREKAGADPL